MSVPLVCFLWHVISLFCFSNSTFKDLIIFYYELIFISWSLVNVTPWDIYSFLQVFSVTLSWSVFLYVSHNFQGFIWRKKPATYVYFILFLGIEMFPKLFLSYLFLVSTGNQVPSNKSSPKSISIFVLVFVSNCVGIFLGVYAKPVC